MQGINGIAIAAAGAGALLLWSGMKGTSVTTALRELLAGQQPSGADTLPITGTPASALGTQTSFTGGSSVSQDALQYRGHKYIYGGRSNVNGGWDCSSFCSWVLGHDLGLTIPGGSWAKVTASGTLHGPTTLSYLAWAGASTVGHSASDAQAGDLCVWQTHMGIATGGGQMISALNPSLGTQVTSVSGGAPFGELLFVRRLVAAPGSGAVITGPGQAYYQGAGGRAA